MPTDQELAKVAVGDTVFVMTGFRRDGFREVTVVKIGRTLVHLSNGDAYRRDTQVRRDAYGYRFYTKAQMEDKQRRDEALKRLRFMGLDSRSGAQELQWSTDQLVAVVQYAWFLRTMNQDDLASDLSRGDLPILAQMVILPPV